MVKKPISMTEMGEVEENCPQCDGTGQIWEDYSPLVVERLDRIIEQNTEIIEILTKIATK